MHDEWIGAGQPDADAREPPLTGLVVLDLGQIFQGPYAGFLMAKAGAKVIKVEPPRGEPLRRRSVADPAAAVPLAVLNANKLGVSLDLKTAKGRGLLLSMVERADVLIENFAPGVMERLGVGWPALRAVNPRLVYASGSGFGLSGPDRDNMAMDLTVQAFSGIMSVTGYPDGPPLKAGPAVVDFISGAHLYAGAVTALVQRARTGKGRLVEIAMQEAVFPALSANLGMLHSSKGAVPPRTGNRHGSLSVAPYNVYSARDGFVALICETDEHWRRLAAAMGRAELADDPRFMSAAQRVKNLEQTDALVQAWAERRAKQEVFELAREHRFPAAPVRDLVELLGDPHMHGRGMLEWVQHPVLGRVVLPNSPLRFEHAGRVETQPSPSLGQHNAEIYGGWLGLDAAAIAALRAEGVI